MNVANIYAISELRKSVYRFSSTLHFLPSLLIDFGRVAFVTHVLELHHVLPEAKSWGNLPF